MRIQHLLVAPLIAVAAAVIAPFAPPAAADPLCVNQEPETKTHDPNDTAICHRITLPTEPATLSCPAEAEQRSVFEVTLSGFPAGTINLSSNSGQVSPTTIQSNGPGSFTSRIVLLGWSNSAQVVASEVADLRAYHAQCGLHEEQNG